MEKVVEGLREDLKQCSENVKGLVAKRKELTKSGGSEVAELKKEVAALREKSVSITKDILLMLAERKKINASATAAKKKMVEARKKGVASVKGEREKVNEAIAAERKKANDIRAKIKNAKYGNREKTGKPPSKRKAKPAAAASTTVASTHQNGGSKQG
jgi:RNA polymerase-binding transcription factor DksA